MIPIADIQADTPDAVIDGMVVSIEERPKGKCIQYIFGVSDFTDAITVKLFFK